MSTHPHVTFIMAAYNATDTIDAALQSLEDQSYSDWDLVVCDDASSDDTLARLRTFAARHSSKVTVLSNVTNRRLSYSLNRCLDVATGRLIARMDADDLSAPRRLEVQVKHMVENPHLQAVGSAMQRFDERGLKDVLIPPLRPDRFSLRTGTPFFHATMMLRREVFENLGGYTDLPRTARGQDRDLWFRFFAAGFRGENLPEALYLVRENAQAVRRRTRKVRFNSWRTSMIGFKMLGYPRAWYILPSLHLLKALVPHFITDIYRSWQHKRFIAQ